MNIDFDTLTVVVAAQISILAIYGAIQYWRLKRDERDRRKLKAWLESRENRLSRERFWQ